MSNGGTGLFVPPTAGTSWQSLLAQALEAEAAGDDGTALRICVAAMEAAKGDAAAAEACQVATDDLADRHVDRTDNCEACRLRGNAAFGRAEYAEAEAEYTSALGHYRRSVDTLANRAACLLKREAWSEALADCELALRYEPKRVKCSFRGATALLALRMPVSALAMLDAALPHSSPAERKQLNSLRARAEAEAGAGDAQRDATAALAAAGARPPPAEHLPAALRPGAAVASAGHDSRGGAAGEPAAASDGCRGVRGGVRPAADVAAEAPTIAAIAKRALTDANVAQFRERGHVAVDLAEAGVSADECGVLASQAAQLHRSGACVGGLQNETKWRDDTACWITPESASAALPALASATKLLGCLAHELNQRLGWEGASALLVPGAAMFASYVGEGAGGTGARYKPHRDNARDEATGAAALAGEVEALALAGAAVSDDGVRMADMINDRAVTVIAYLNDSWGPCDGGALRVHEAAVQSDDAALFDGGWEGGIDGGGAAGPYHDYAPRVGRVAIFRSEMLHEVLPSAGGKLRLALTMWMTRRGAP